VHKIATMQLGVDIAHAGMNGPVDWARAKAQGSVTFAILRSNWGTATDEIFMREWDAVQSAGLVTGAYLFLRFRTKKHGAAPTPEAQAKAMVKTLTGRLVKGKHFPPTLDVEFPGKGAVETRLGAAELLDGVRRAWTALREGLGVRPIIYTSGRVWREDLRDLPAKDLVESPLWLARYLRVEKRAAAVRDPVRIAKVTPKVPLRWGGPESWFIHQYQGDATQLPGFVPKDKVDMNRFHNASRGDQGGHVAWIQRRLGMPAANGTFDAATETAIRTLQQANGLNVDGMVGPRSFAVLAWAADPA
jgi:GH25 family lysozyme M1 (1,4-beta-N-acetylmuramidase)